MDNKELVSALRKQHEDLAKKISGCLGEAEKGFPDYKKISSDLEDFNKDLSRHLALENDVFYPKLLGYLGTKGMPTSGMEKFIREMMGIQEKVIIFFAKYDNAEKINSSKECFHADLREMASVLSLRIEAEEDCAYVYLE